MARTLTADTQTETAKTDAVEPYNLVKVEWGGTVGTKWYGDRDWGDGDASTWAKAQARVVVWGRMLAQTSLHPKPSVGDVTVELRDDDAVLHGFLIDEQLENKKVTIYQQFVGNAEADLTVIFKGTVSGPVQYKEAGANSAPSLRFDVTDMGSFYNRTFTTIADDDTFSDVHSADEGKAIPICYGKVKRGPTLFAKAGKRGRLQNEITTNDGLDDFYVEGGEEFPSGAITIMVGQEYIEGSFSGEKFTPTTRGAQVDNGTILGTSQNPRVFATSFSGTQGQYVGHFLKVRVRGADGTDGFQHRRIIRHAANGTIEVVAPFYYQGFVESWDAVATDFYYGVGQQYWVPAQQPAWIVTKALPHQPGEQVVQVLNEYVYIANDRPSVRVNAVYGYGRKLTSFAQLGDIEGLAFGSGAWIGSANAFQMRMQTLVPSDTIGTTPPNDYLSARPQTRDVWVTIDPSLYVVDTNDSQFSGDIGHNVTTITFSGLPPALMGLYDFGSEELRVDIEGIDASGDGTGALLENPAVVIKDFLETIGGVAEADTDDTAFTDAEGRMDGLLFGFSKQFARASKLGEVAQDMAFQSRCSLNWDDGVAFLRWLINGSGTSTLTIDDTDVRSIDSLVKTHTNFATEVYSEVVAGWVEVDQEREVAVVDATAESAHGRKVLDIVCWALTRKTHVKNIATFWLNRLKQVWTVLGVTTYLKTLELQREDTVELDLTTYAPSGAEATVMQITHRPGSAGIIDEIDYELLSWWCETSCQAMCETAGCETDAQLGACTSMCETSAQGYCEQECVIGEQLICPTSIEAADCDFVEGTDVFDCDSTAVETTNTQITDTDPCTITSCTTCACQSCGCQVGGCESNGCQGGDCETTGCESCSCQTCGCQLGACETDACQSIACECGCETACDAACETDSQAQCACSSQACGGAEACVQVCQCTCQAGNCECGCEDGACQVGIEA